MKLYSVPPSPFASRVRIAIYRKELPIEIVAPPEGGTRGEAFLALNPMGQLPTLVLDSGFAIPESAAILEYLEDVFPTPSLRPADPEIAARARLFLRIPDTQMQGAPRVLLSMRKPEDRKPDVVEAQLQILRGVLKNLAHYTDAAPWAVGGAPSLADCALIPILNIMNLIERVYETDLIGGFDTLAAYWGQAKDEPVHARVIAEQWAGLPADIPRAVAA